MANPTGKGLKPYQPGQSGNPGGRPKGLMPLIREMTADGVELVDFHLAMMRDPKNVPTDRLRAAQWLTERGFGKAVERVEVSGPGGGPLQTQSFDYDAALAPLAAGSVGDREPPGEAEGGRGGEALG